MAKSMVAETEPLFAALDDVEAQFMNEDYDELFNALERYHDLDLDYLTSIFEVDYKRIEMVNNAQEKLYSVVSSQWP